jgi:hypothetical protein
LFQVLVNTLHFGGGGDDDDDGNDDDDKNMYGFGVNH